LHGLRLATRDEAHPSKDTQPWDLKAQIAAQMILSQQHLARANLQHELQSRNWIQRVQRHITAAGLRMPSNPTIISGERSTHNPTDTSGPNAQAAKSAAVFRRERFNSR